MKIVRQGTPPGERIWSGKCHTCKTEADAAGKELVINQGDQRDGPFGEAKCPVCGAARMFFYPKKDGAS